MCLVSEHSNKRLVAVFPWNAWTWWAVDFAWGKMETRFSRLRMCRVISVDMQGVPICVLRTLTIRSVRRRKSRRIPMLIHVVGRARSSTERTASISSGLDTLTRSTDYGFLRTPRANMRTPTPMVATPSIIWTRRECLQSAPA